MTKLLTITIFCFVVCIAKAQDTVFLKKEARQRTYTDREPQVFFVELGGPGQLSANYDRRFAKQTDGWGFRGGLGYLNSSDYSLYSVPIGLNYLAGKKGKYLEVGLNESLIVVNVTSKYYYNNYVQIFDKKVTDQATIPLTSLTIGYRSQPVIGGFCFRGGLMPYTTFEGSSSLSIYLSFGYNF